MNLPIEGLHPEEPKIDKRTKEYRESLRADVRADVRSEAHSETRDSIREAELRAQEISDSLGDSVYQTDEFYVDPNVIPAGWSYQWRRMTVAGKEDPHYMVSLKHSGWREVPVSRHPEMMPIGWEGAIEKKGLVLMELPKILVDRKQADDKREAIDQLRNSEAMLREAPPNTATRDDPGLAKAGLNVAKRTFERPIPQSD